MIGILGSGIDGMIIAKAIRGKIPDVDILCFIDNLCIFPADAPDPERIRKNTAQNMTRLVKCGAGLILIASHTISCIVGPELADECPVPVLDIVSAAVEQAVRRTRYRRMGIIGRRTIIDSGIYPETIRQKCPEAVTYSVSCPLLIPLIDEGWIHKQITAMIVKRYLIPLKTRQIDSLILASTPYTILSSVIQRKIGKRVEMIDGIETLPETAVSFLNSHPEIGLHMQRAGQMQVMVAWASRSLEMQAKAILNSRIRG